MGLFKKLVIAIFISTATLAAAPSVMAAGKIENQKPAETAIAIDETLAQSEATLEAMKAGGEIKAVLADLKKTKTFSKTIEAATTAYIREKALGSLAKARSAYKKGKSEEAIVKMTKAVAQFKELKKIYTDFMN
ncbi:MAG: hypothetical protein GQ569_12510 [Methylococcaceae bacterium]|nr:hypothetical protein [Methylococcaceae bacterium]